MKKKILYILILPLIFFSCGDDDAPAPPHEVGVWELDSYLFINFPAGFEGNEGATFGVSELSFGGAVYEDYVLNINADGTYTRDISITGPDLDDSGTWELEDGVLTFDSEDIGEDPWVVERNEDDDLWLSFEAANLFIPDIYFDTVTQAYIDYLNTLTNEELDSVGSALDEEVVFDLVFVFERE